MLDFEEMRQALEDGDEEAVEVSKADLFPIGSFVEMPEGASAIVFDNYFPETTIWREGDRIVAEITEHIYTKFWEHKWHGRVFAEAMLRAIKRFISEGDPFTEGTIENDDDPHIFIRWQLRLPITTTGQQLIDSVMAAFDSVYARADMILENSDTVLVLGKDTGEALDRLRRIAMRLDTLPA
jgi:hypothetical protein